MPVWVRFFAVLLPVLLLALIVATMSRFGGAQPDPVVEEAQAMTVEEPQSPAEAALDRELNALGSTFSGHVGIAVEDVAQQRIVHFNGMQEFPQQSVSKLWVSMTALSLVDRGKLDLAERVRIEADDLTVFHQPLRSTVLSRGSLETDYRDLIERALTRSDNTANDLILRRSGGPKKVQAFLDRHGLSSIRFGTDERTKQSRIAGLEWQQEYSVGPAFYDARDQVPEPVRREAFESYLADPMDGATPVGIVAALGRLARGELLSPETSAYLLETLADTRSGPQRLKGGVPPGWGFAHKTGTGQFFDGEQSGYNDIGILTAPDGSQYAIAAMIGRTRAPTPERFVLMQAVTRAVAEYHEAKKEDTTPEEGDSVETEE